MKEIFSLGLIGIAIPASHSLVHAYYILGDPTPEEQLRLLFFMLIIPYFAAAIPAAVTKWLLLALIIKRTVRPTVARLSVVAVCEFCCALIATVCVSSFSVPLAIILYSLLAVAPNLLLFPSRNPDGFPGSHFLRRGLSAFSLGLLYLGYCLVMIMLWFSLVGSALGAC